MPNFESSASAGAKLHEIITDHAQMYVYGSESIQNIHSSMEHFADSYRGDLDSAKFEIIQRRRISRQAILAALGRIIGDEIVKKALTYSDGETLDITGMTKGIKPTYCDGMMGFLEETVDDTLYSMTDSDHPYHDFFRHVRNYEADYIPLLGNGNKRMGSIKIPIDVYNALMDMFVANYHNDVASFLVTHGIVSFKINTKMAFRTPIR